MAKNDFCKGWGRQIALFLTGMGLFALLLTGCGGQAAQMPEPPKEAAKPAVSQKEPEKLVVPAKGVPVLMYHQIGPEKGNDAVVSEELFASQMEFLYKNGYHPITMEQLYQYVVHKQPLPEKPVAITFDDGYRDTYEIVMPLLKKYGFHSTVFVPVDFVGKVLTWDELRAMKQAGMEIASHSYLHVDLSTLSKEEQRQQLKQSKEVFDKELQQNTRWYCYPYGGYNEYTSALMREVGYDLGVTMNPGWAVAGDDVLRLNRVWIGNAVTLKWFEERLNRPDYTSVSD